MRNGGRLLGAQRQNVYNFIVGSTDANSSFGEADRLEPWSEQDVSSSEDGQSKR